MTRLTPEIAVNRFGLGARPGELALAARDPQAWLEGQLGPLVFDEAAGSSGAVLALLGKRVEDKRAGIPAPMAQDEVKAIVAMGQAMAADTLSRAIGSNRPLAARLLDFFSNHFSVSTGPTPMRGLAATLEREAVGPNLGGRFVEMLLAVERHPAMLTYLNNAQSVGPGSRMGRRQSRGLNENLAREMLELHTLGVDGGYAQADVRELAMAITGWSVGLPRRNEEPAFLFREATHEPGARVVLGRRYEHAGVAQGERILRDLARHPATVRHLCTKLARHMVADDPPPALVAAMTARWTASDGNISEVVRALIAHPEALAPAQRKLKTPREFVISVMRAARLAPPRGIALLGVLTELGQPALGAGSPAGFKDVAGAWDGAEALMTRIDWVEQLGERIRRGEPLAIARESLGGWLSPRTVTAIQGADSRRQALSLLFMSPAFLRR
jgi:uncharacterized protein (DUF1800 family)